MTEKDLLDKLEERGFPAADILRAGYGPDKKVLVIGLHNTIHAVEAVLVKEQVVSITPLPYETETERATEHDIKLLQKLVDDILASAITPIQKGNA